MVECLLCATWKAGPVWCCNSLSLGQVELEGLTGHIGPNPARPEVQLCLENLAVHKEWFPAGKRKPSLLADPSSFALSLPPGHFSLGTQDDLPRAAGGVQCKASPRPAPGSASVDKGPQPQQNTKREATVLHSGRGKGAFYHVDYSAS